MHHLTAFDALCAQLVPGGFDIVGAADKMNQPWALLNGFLHQSVIHVEPTGHLRALGNHGIGVDGNDFKIGQGVVGRGDFEQTVVGAVFFVFTTCVRGDAQSVLAPLHACIER